ncbi:MAG: tyrosine--tRNA ligase [Planctomycetota bacterium]|nr:tyrosine--tRNA ligase [Planctomycetota bacterium]MDI6788120.1 tyrosine--tRNA ligase [Planctomycetota bacterium]
MLEISRQLEVIKRGVVDFHTEEELVERLKLKRPLRVKLGVDPTAPDIHLGHTVVLQKLRHFQGLGHDAILIIGDFTSLIGDPSGREKTRPQLSAEEIEVNAQTYLNQVGKILNLKHLQIVHNSTWLAKLTMKDIIKIASQVTVARFIERDDFSNRLKNQIPIGLHEFLYPLLQGQDSVAIEADIELGGTDQIFNLLVGRDLQRAVGQPPQIVLTTPLLVGLDGTKKMSKSFANHIGVTEPPFEMYSKTMSLPDNLMEGYFTLLTSLDSGEIKRVLSGHPKQAKVILAKEIVTQYYSKSEAERAAEKFETIFARKGAPDEIEELQIKKTMLNSDGRVYLPKLLSSCDVVRSSSEAKRLIMQGGLTIDGRKFTDPDKEIVLKSGQVLKIGKKNRFYRVITTE